MNGMDWESMKHRTIHTGKDRGIFCGTAAAQLEVKDSRLVYNRNQQFEMRP